MLPTVGYVTDQSDFGRDRGAGQAELLFVLA